MEIINTITLFIFITSILHILSYLFRLIINLKLDTPEPIEINTFNKIILLLSSSYIITYIITLFN